MTKTAELTEFVKYQAREDALLEPAERRYQEQLVADVLSQEHLGAKSYKRFIELYQAEKQAA